MSKNNDRQCLKCGKELEPSEVRYLKGQTYCEEHYKAEFAAFKATPSSESSPASDASTRRIRSLALAGLLVGAFVGFLLRPSAPLVGQLPFGIVINRGATLTGMDEFLKPLAERSFNVTLGGAVLGSIVGALIAWGIGASDQRRSVGESTGTRIDSEESREERECPHCAERILVKAKVCKHCGLDTSATESPANQAASPDATPP